MFMFKMFANNATSSVNFTTNPAQPSIMIQMGNISVIVKGDLTLNRVNVQIDNPTTYSTVIKGFYGESFMEACMKAKAFINSETL